MRNNKARDERPRNLKPVKTIELSEDNVKRRWIMVGIFIAIAIVAFGVWLISALTVEPGWIEVEAESSYLHCGEDFIFSYYLGAEEESPTKEKKQLKTLYSEAAVKAYWLFDTTREFEGGINICYLNNYPNTELEIDPALYKALSTAKKGGRWLYLGGLYVEYETLFFGIEDYPSSAEWDPMTNSEFGEYCQKLATFASDSEAIELELLGNNRVILHVSEEYLSYARENNITVFIDFHRMKNAFVIDYLADVMTENGYTHGCISSYDGYVRNLDGSGTTYSLNLFDMNGEFVYNAARLDYNSKRSTVTLRSYPMGEKDGYSFYSLPGGKIIPPYIDCEDGLYRTATDTLISYSENEGCSELLMRLLPIYVEDTLDTDALNSLTASGVYSIWFEGSELYHNQENINLSGIYSDENIAYKAVFSKKQ